MDTSEFRKIVNDGLIKHKAFKEAEKALDEIDGLKQAKIDLTRVKDTLFKEVEALKSEKAAAEREVSEEKQKAVSTLIKADVDAKTILDEAKNKAEALIAKAKAESDRVHDAVKATIDELDRLTVSKEKAAAEYEKLSALLDAKKAEIKRLLGD